MEVLVFELLDDLDCSRFAGITTLARTYRVRETVSLSGSESLSEFLVEQPITP